MALLLDFTDSEFDHFLATRSEFAPFPRCAERLPWSELPDMVRADAVRLAEGYLDYSWPSLLAERYMDFLRNGDRERYQKVYFERRDAVGALVAGECIEAEGRFVDQIVNGLWLILEESSWVVPAHNVQRWKSADDVDPLPDVENRYIDLFAAQTGALVALSAYLLPDELASVSPLIPRRIERALVERIIEPYMAHDDFWWMAFDEAQRKRVNNWNPCCNSNCLAVSLLADPNDERRAEMVRKACAGIDFFIESYGADGGCDEGPSYWGHAGGSLFDCLELLFFATGGRVDLWSDERIANIGRYIRHVRLADSWYVNFADCVPRVSPPADVVYRYGKRIGDDSLRDFGARLFADALTPSEGSREGERLPAVVGFGGARDLFRFLHAAFDAAEILGLPATSEADLSESTWFPSIQVAVARQAGESGFVLASKGGHNAESHNHNDVGQIIVIHDGAPVLVDPGVETYTAKTFSDRRYEIWTMQSAYHNLPTVGGYMQRPDAEPAAGDVQFDDDGQRARLELELATAYPAEAGIVAWRRTVTLDREAGRVVLADSFRLDSSREIEWTFMTPTEPAVRPTDGTIELAGGVGLSVRGLGLTPRIERVAVEDSRLEPHWGSALYRLLLSVTAGDGEVSFELAARR